MVDGGQRALLLGGVDQSRVVTGTPSSALSTIAKIDLNSGPAPVRPVVNFSATSQTVNEGVGSAPVQISLSQVSAVDVTIPFSFGGSASAADYALPNGSSIVIPAGQTAGSLQVRIVDDALDEKAERLNIALGTPTNGTTGVSNFFALNINDNDNRPSVSFDRASSFVTEGGQTAVVLQLSAPSTTTH